MKIRKHHDNTLHAVKRAIQRAKLPSDFDANIMISEARNSGIEWFDLPPGELADFVKSKASIKNKIVKYYKGWIYVFFRTSKRCITMYESPIKIDDSSIQSHPPSKAGGYVDPALKTTK